MDSIKEILSNHKLKSMNITKMNDNYSSDVYTLSDNHKEYILKFFVDHASFKIEFEVFRQVLPENISRIEKGINGGLYYIIREKLKGTPLTNNSEINNDLIFDIGRKLGEFHQRFDSFKFTEQISVRDIFEDWVSKADQLLTKEISYKVRQVFECYEESFLMKDSTLTHMDFRLGNIIVLNGKVSSIIDFEKSKITDRYFDFSKIKREINEIDYSLWISFKEGYQSVCKRSDKIDDRKVEFFDFLHCLGALAFIAKNKRSKDSDFFIENYNLVHTYVERF